MSANSKDGDLIIVGHLLMVFVAVKKVWGWDGTVNWREMVDGRDGKGQLVASTPCLSWQECDGIPGSQPKPSYCYPARESYLT